MTASRVLLLGTIISLSGCASAPVAPRVMALPGSEKSLEQFHADDTFCRQWAAQRDQATVTGAPAGQSPGTRDRQQWYDMAYLQCMYAKGNRIPGVMTGPLPPPPSPPTAPASPGPPPAPGAEQAPPRQAP
jgi:hypothetical protein